MADGSPEISREAEAREPFPYLSGLSAQRVIELVALQLAPAATAAGMAYTHLDSEWQGFLVFVSMLAVGVFLRRPQYPLHLIPVASAALYLLTAPLGAGVAVAISGLDGSSTVTPDEMVAPVLGAWLVTGIGALIARSFRINREVRVAVIGSHEFTRGLQAELDAVGVRGYNVLGCIEPERPCEHELVAGVRCLGSLADLRPTLERNSIELLVLGPLGPPTSEDTGEGQFKAVGVSRLDVFEKVADACLDLPVSMIEAGQLYEQLFGHVPLGTTTSAWFQFLLHPNYKASWPLSKRLLDLAVGGLAAIVAAPILLVSAIAIKLSDGGPVLYRQTRLGERGREISLIKLRTMHKDYDTIRGSSEENWVTPVGRILRRLHVNELPQIWQVLRGEMSLVGPRPEIPEIVTSLESRYTYYDRRHLLKPGITGWASVRCGYSGTPVGEAWKLCHDLYYLKRRSILFDVLIMLETLSTVFVSEPIKRPDERFIVGIREQEEVAAVEAPVASQVG
jgi:lipopolysaccharide/colanic/teichoic acid biosynthesis glycosyltransferase